MSSPGDPTTESEAQTRRRRIDPKLKSQDWTVTDFVANQPVREGQAVAEYPTANGPADYVLCLDSEIIGIVEAKKVKVGPQNVLTQAGRYSQGVRETTSQTYAEGYKVPFLYSTNGEIIWFQDVRHGLNRSRKVSNFHTPKALREMLDRDPLNDLEKLRDMPFREGAVYPFQESAVLAIEQALRDRNRQMMVVMATGTGKTRTTIQQIYRLMKSGAAKRVLFLVDRRALAAQAVRALASFQAEPGQKFDQIYEVYSQKFQSGDFDSEDDFDPKALPNRYLTDPQAGDAFVYVSTIQRMAINLFGRQGMFEGEQGEGEEDAEKENIPIHAFDLIVADECHRGYSRKEQAIWRDTLDHFDAIKIGLTATPAAHTVAYFGDPVFRYTYKEAIDAGYLVDYDVVKVRSEVRIKGVKLNEGTRIELVDTQLGTVQNIDYLEDEVSYDATEIEAKITSPDSNRKIVAALKQHCEAHEAEYGRFPKTLIFAANDLQHTSHANQLVTLLRKAFGRGDGFVSKITGAKDVDRPLQRIKEFRNRPEPKIVVTVDLLSTGVDIPAIEFLVFLRPVKSRILFEQMLGRGTRLCKDLDPAKSHFVVFDCFDGTLIENFRNASTMALEAPVSDPVPLAEVVENIWNNVRREYHVKVLAKRLRRMDKEITGDGRVKFLEFTGQLDVATFADKLDDLLKRDFTGTMGLLRNSDFQTFLKKYPRPHRDFVIANEVIDEVTSERLIRYGDLDLRPADYLTEFSKFVEANRTGIEALRILLDKPEGWSAEALLELRTALRRAQFPEEKIREAVRIAKHKALADVISMVKNAADENRALLTAEERVNVAISQVTGTLVLSEEQRGWLDLIRQRLVQDLAIEPADFDSFPLDERGGFRKADRVFDGNLKDLLGKLNWAVARAA